MAAARPESGRLEPTATGINPIYENNARVCETQFQDERDEESIYAEIPHVTLVEEHKRRDFIEVLAYFVCPIIGLIFGVVALVLLLLVFLGVAAPTPDTKNLVAVKELRDSLTELLKPTREEVNGEVFKFTKTQTVKVASVKSCQTKSKSVTVRGPVSRMQEYLTGGDVPQFGSTAGPETDVKSYCWIQSEEAPDPPLVVQSSFYKRTSPYTDFNCQIYGSLQRVLNISIHFYQTICQVEEHLIYVP